MTKMKALTVNLVEPDRTMEFQDWEIPRPSEDELLVKVKAFGVNRADLLQRWGKYPISENESPILGLEISGEIVEKGRKCQQFEIGELVFGLVSGGGYAEYCLLHCGLATRVPNSISFTEAAALPEAFLTCHQTLFEAGNLKSGETVLIHAGASSIGSLSILMSKFKGCRVISTVGSSEKASFVKELGADEIYQYQLQDFNTEIASQLYHRIDLIQDFIGAKYFQQHLSLLKEKGRLILVGLLGGAKTEVNLAEILFRRIQVIGFVLRKQNIHEKIKMTQIFREQWLPWIEKRKILPPIYKVFDWKNINQAHGILETRQNKGKIIVTL